MAAKKSRTLKNKNAISKLGKIWIAVFVVVFVAVGAFVIYRSFAAGSSGNPVVYNTPSTLYPGNSSRAVLALRAYLYQDTGYNAGLPISSNSTTYDPALVQAVKNFQAFFKLNVDGIVGPQTWTVLFKVFDTRAAADPYSLVGDGPRVISTQASFGGALIRVYCPVGSNGARYKTIQIFEQVYGKSGVANCGSDGTAYVGINYNDNTSLLKGQHVYQIYGGPDGYGGTGSISHLTFVTMSL